MSMPAPVLLLDSATVATLLSLDECSGAVESAFAMHARGRTMRPQLLHIESQRGEFHVKAGGLHEPRSYFACKVNGGFFGNRKRSALPNIIGLIVLCDGATGAPLALMESGLVTRMRTAAATAVAAKYLARTDSHTVTICGAGAQAGMQLRALSAVLPLQRAFVWTRGDAGAFAEGMAQDLGIAVRCTTDLAAATRQSDVIVTCTPTRHWFLGREHVVAGTFIAAVGADSPEKQEIEPQLLASASVVCDLVDQCAQVGDLHHAIEAGLMAASDVRGELGAVVAGMVAGRGDDREIIVFDSTGTALQDAAAAAMLYEKAVSGGRGPALSFWT